MGEEAQVRLEGRVLYGDHRSAFIARVAKIVGDVFEIKDADSFIERLATVSVGATDLRRGDNLRELSMVNTTQGVSAGSQGDCVVVVEVGISKVSQLTLEGVLRLRNATRSWAGGIDTAAP